MVLKREATSSVGMENVPTQEVIFSTEAMLEATICKDLHIPETHHNPLN